MTRLILLILLVLSASGCSGIFKIVTEDPVRELPLIATNEEGEEEEIGLVISLTAERRNFVILTSGKAQFCAEPSPDTAKAVDTLAKITAEASVVGQGEGKLDITDDIKERVFTLTERTATMDLFRQSVYGICQLYMAGALDSEAAQDSFIRLVQIFQEIAVSGSVQKN